MVEIITKRDGPRREDVEARRLIENNRGTIDRIADRLTGGGYSARRRAEPAPPPPSSSVIVHALGGAPQGGEPQPHIRVSTNGRVVMVDCATGRQMHHLGEVRRCGGIDRFLVATRENGFFAPVAEEVAEAIADLDRAPIVDSYTEEQLAADISTRLDLG